MYLLTFTLLIVAMLGIYTQVFAIETARLFASQTGIAQTMLQWHNAASSLAGNIVNPNSAGTAGCSLTANVGTACPLGNGVSALPNVTTVAMTGVTYTVNASGAQYPQLAPKYNSIAYQWKSIAFQNGTGYYVVTYVDPPTISASNPAPGFISTASNQQLGITEADLFQQMRNLNIPLYAYGTVNNGVLTVPPLNGLSHASYAVPSPPILNGSFAIISSPGQCNGC